MLMLYAYDYFAFHFISSDAFFITPLPLFMRLAAIFIFRHVATPFHDYFFFFSLFAIAPRQHDAHTRYTPCSYDAIVLPPIAFRHASLLFFRRR